MIWKVSTVCMIFVCLVLLGCLIAIIGSPRPSEPRFLGVWISDGTRTMEGLRAQWDPPEERIGKLGDLVGQMKVTVTESTITTELGGTVLSMPYTVLARDAHSAVIRDDSPPIPELEAMGFFRFSGGLL